MRKIRAFIISIVVFILAASPVFAITNPDNIDFGTGADTLYKVFENVIETGDMLFVAEGYVNYVAPADFAPYSAGDAFLFEVLDVAGVVTLLSVPLNQFGDRPISIYQTAAQVTAVGLVTETAYKLRITGNPTVFPLPTGNTVTVTLTPTDYVDQSIGKDTAVPTENDLRNFLIDMAENIEVEDSPALDYIVDVQGYRYLSSGGADIFIEGIPGIQSFCAILFQYSIEPIESDAPASTGSYALTLTPLEKWGETTANGLTNLGVYLGINQALAGSLVLMVLVMGLAAFVYSRTKSGVTVLLMVSSMPFLGAYLGLMPMALAFIFVIMVVVLMGYYFFSRGAL